MVSAASERRSEASGGEERRSERRAVFLATVPNIILAIGLSATGRIQGDVAALLIGAAFLCPLVGIWALSGSKRAAVMVAAPADPPPPASVPEDILECFPDPVILLNRTRQIVAINRPAREMLGVGMLGRDLSLSLRHPDVLAAVETVLAGVPGLSEEITLPLPQQRTFTLHAGLLGSAETAGGERVVIVLHDETPIRRAEKSRADFVANASHELRSPLSAVVGFIETLQGPASDDAEARERFLAIMHSEAMRMARLIEDLMSLSRVEFNEHVPPRGQIDLATVLSSVADALTVRAAARDMTISVAGVDERCPMIGDADQLTQVFHNLIDNAIKYGRPGTTIKVTCQTVERLPRTQVPGAVVSVADEGEGILSIHVPRLTERFYRVDEGRSRRLGGTGLGLAIVKHILNRHRGRLAVESQEGVGSTFTVYLPLHPKLPAAGSVVVPADVPPTATKL